ncbi:hypothetical protein [Mycolicibacillus parakoreensis]|uniref:hypothetical protein n=1 Tax=Mycolicibacillus parakoreensis TaxID=1069221 RepID=UPI003898DA42
MWDFWVLLLIIATIAVLAAPLLKKWRRPSDAQEGTLLITGVSPRPDDVTGEQYVTLAGVINGPTVSEYSVYRRTAVDVADWPKMGELRPVVYSQRNPDNWQFSAAAGGPLDGGDHPQ